MALASYTGHIAERQTLDAAMNGKDAPSQYEPIYDFDAWNYKPWHVEVIDGSWKVYISPACLEQARSTNPPGTDVIEIICSMAADRYADFRWRWRTTQHRLRSLPAPYNSWRFLLYLEAIYVDVMAHPFSDEPK